MQICSEKNIDLFWLTALNFGAINSADTQPRETAIVSQLNQSLLQLRGCSDLLHIP